MLLTVEGAYRDGEIELAEIPENVEQADVLVTFLKTKKILALLLLRSVRRGNED